jgi:hypothetical protein
MGSNPRSLVLSRLYNRMYRLAYSRGWASLAPCARRSLWALPAPAYAGEDSAAFLVWAALWGPLRGLGGLRDEYGVSLLAYAERLNQLLGGEEACWLRAGGTRGYEVYLRECRGLRVPSHSEEAAFARLVEGLARG